VNNITCRLPILYPSLLDADTTSLDVTWYCKTKRKIMRLHWKAVYGAKSVTK